MSQHNRILDLPFLAGENLNTAGAQHRAVFLSAAGTVRQRASLAGQFPIGILQNGGVGGVASGGVANVRVLGSSKLFFASSVGVGQPFKLDSAGAGLEYGDQTVTASFVHGGYTLEASPTSTGALVEVVWGPIPQTHTGSQTTV